MFRNIFHKLHSGLWENEKKKQEVISNVSPLPHPIDILVVADTHGCVNLEEFRAYFTSCGNVDICLFLGDHTDADVGKILSCINSNIPCIGLLGNHDYRICIDGETKTYLTKYHISDLNGVTFEWKGIVLVGMEGSYRYKSEDFPSFTQEESEVFCDALPKADIFVTHDAPFSSTENLSHQGLLGITNYVKEKQPSYHLHGHLHDAYRRNVNSTIEISTYMYWKHHLE